jgi:trehalose 6-phosphate phosphatase
MTEPLAALLQKLSRSDRLILALDFDGTLVPLFKGHHGRPEAGPSLKRLLTQLAHAEGIHLAFASGRGLADLRRRLQIPKSAYIGNHGLEAADGPWVWTHPTARRDRPAIASLAKALLPAVESASGASLEDKGLSLSLHFRAVKGTPQLRKLEQAVNAHVAASRGAVRVLHGKKVWNLNPAVDWDKGRALLHWVKARNLRGTLVFIGDDKTDEEGFRSLGRRAVCVKVGPGVTVADYRIRQRDVRLLLEVLLAAHRRRRRGKGLAKRGDPR